jgi:cytosine/adenosine deaminase-related metal-dependent hydrolase
MSVNSPKKSPVKFTTVLRARCVLPVSQPPIENGAIGISGNRIVAVGRWADFPKTNNGGVLDLGESILMPGLVNAHCHLDYTAMAGQLTPPRSFVDWLKLITASKGDWIYSHFAESWLRGATMLLRTGTTTVGDIEMIHELLPEAWSATPLRVFSFLEMTGVKSRRPPAEIISEALKKIDSLPRGRCQMGFSPHAPYSTTPALLELAAETARKHKLRLTIHVAESAEEFEMFRHGRGNMFDWLAKSGRDMSDCGQRSPVQHLEEHGLLGKNLLAVHVNYLAPGDAALLGQRQVSVVHCPRSHAYFKHRSFPFAELAGCGINICLGTDSLASLHKPRKQVLELNLFDEMREFAALHKSLAPETIVEMATVNGAIALGMKNQIGELASKAFADLIAIPYAGKLADANAAVIHHRGNVAASMINGKWAIEPG